jgi:hypothetical protein
MSIRTGGTAPYAPPLTVLHVINQFRERGLGTPITENVLLKASVSESLAPRTLAALRVLELIDAEGNPTTEMEGLRRAKSDEFAPKLEALVRNVYAEVFQYTDPSKDDGTKVADAFRDYEPAGQRARMVSLFLGLCAAAGILPENAARKTVAPLRGAKKSETARRATASMSKTKGANELGGIVVVSGIDPAINGLLQKLPKNGEGWTELDRKRWLEVFTSVVDFAIPIQATTSGSSPDDEE